MAAQFRIGASLSTAIQSLGFRGDIGYHTFLYSNDIEIRRVFMFLVDRLPKEHSDAEVHAVGTPMAILRKQIAVEMSKQLSQPWVPPAFRRKNELHAAIPFESCRLSAPGVSPLDGPSASKDVCQFCSSQLPYVCSQPRNVRQLSSALNEALALHQARAHDTEITWSQQGPIAKRNRQELEVKRHDRLMQKIATQFSQYASQSAGSRDDVYRDFTENSVTNQKKLSRFAQVERKQFAPDDETMMSKMEACVTVSGGQSQEHEKREQELTSLQESVQNHASQVKDLSLTTKNLSLGIQHITEQMKDYEVDNGEKDESLRVRKLALDLLPDADNNISRLEAMAESGSKRLINLATQWEKHRVPLIDRYRTLRDTASGAMLYAERQLEDLKELQSKLKQLTADARDKDQLYKQLVTEYEQMTKDVNRSAYTQRILEIVASIRKQNQDIDKVLIDTKAVQKEINVLTGKLDRIFAVTDELIFRDAKKDDAVRKSYKYLASFHENCNLLIKTVEESGVIMREIRDLEDQLESEEVKKLTSNLERISSDFRQMKAENNALMSKLKHQQQTSS